MKLTTAVALGLVAFPVVSGFAPVATPSRSPTALGMSDLLNQQKAAAIRAAEARNQAEIEALKLQIAQIESLFNGASTGYSPAGFTPTGLPSDIAYMNQNQLQGKLAEFKNYLGTLLKRSEDNQRQFASLTGGPGGAIGTAAIAGATGALLTNALDSNRRDSIGGIIAGAAGSIASSLSGPSKARAPVVSNDPRAQVSEASMMQFDCVGVIPIRSPCIFLCFIVSLYWPEFNRHFLEHSPTMIWSTK